MLVVVFLATTTAAGSAAKMTLTLRRTRSAAASDINSGLKLAKWYFVAVVAYGIGIRREDAAVVIGHAGRSHVVEVRLNHGIG